MADNMKALRLAKKDLRQSVRQRISSLSEESIRKQCTYIAPGGPSLWLIRLCHHSWRSDRFDSVITGIPEREKPQCISLHAERGTVNLLHRQRCAESG